MQRKDPEEAYPEELRMRELDFAGATYFVFSHALPRAPLPSGLSDTEAAVALLVMHGLSNAEIAHVRGTSPRTIANQLAAMYRKLGVSSRVELAARLVAVRGNDSSTAPRR